MIKNGNKIGILTKGRFKFMILKEINELKCECINDYLSGKIKDFPGIQFKKSSIYRFDKPDTKCKFTKLVAVINDETDSYVGMNIDTFNMFFIVILDPSDIKNKKICEDYNINFKYL